VIAFRGLTTIVADDENLLSEEVYPRDPALLTVCGIEDRRMFVCASEEKRYWDNFEDGRGVSTMSVRIKPELAQ